jgi:hypothetical protein
MKSKHVIDQAINMNLMNALNYALLNLPEKFTEEQLYMVGCIVVKARFLSEEQEYISIENCWYFLCWRFSNDIWRESKESSKYCVRKL